MSNEERFAVAEQRPDIVFVIPDQLSARWLEEPCRSAFPTPNLDRLRREGVTFTRFISANPVCCPTRATIATGLTPKLYVCTAEAGADPVA